MKNVVGVLLLLGVAAATTKGVDLSSLYASSDWDCLYNKSYSFAIPRCFRSTGAVDTNCASSVSRAWAAGFLHVDVYMFPCPTCSANATSQVDTLLTYLSENSVKYGMIWLDIEGTSYWSSSYSTNQNFYGGLVSQLKAKGKSFGTYTNKSQWTSIMGSSYTGGSSTQLWWAYWPSTFSSCFAGWSSFAGWTSAAMQQYTGSETICAMSVDQDCY
eukprot:TRINITY_DN1957_c0_g1_i10.p1 TRINITY_DN1957_c0_g1~~TRINITY_DN1957_c0_g1_i10.p1  ORF type:complete len:215 (+),score=48.12 TRINITY_DN1957_c0_g1_i10:125-769(+)